MMSTRKSISYYLIFFFTGFFLILVFWLHEKSEKTQIKKYYYRTVGNFEEFHSGVESAPSIDYSYYAFGKKYNGSVQTFYKYEYCKGDDKCKDKQFWVIYSQTNPEKSLIDLSQEIQGLKNPLFPNTLDNFK